MLLDRIVSTLYPSSFLLLTHYNSNDNKQRNYIQSISSINTTTLTLHYIIHTLVYNSICQNIIYIALHKNTLHIEKNHNKLYNLLLYDTSFDLTAEQCDQQNNITNNKQYITRHHFNNLDLLLQRIKQVIESFNIKQATKSDNNNSNTVTNTDSTINDVDEQQQIKQTTIPIIIDSIVPLLLRYNIQQVSSFLATLKSLPNVILISTWSTFCIHNNAATKTVNMLQYISTSYILCNTINKPTLQSTESNIIDSVIIQYDVIHKRKSGKCTVAIETVQLNIDNCTHSMTTNIIDRKQQRDILSSTTHNDNNSNHTTAEQKRMNALSTMNLSMTDKQRQQRDNTILPYTKQQLNNNNLVSHSGLFTVHGIQQQTIEQHDKTDPDEALDEDIDELDIDDDDDNSDPDADLNV